MFIITFKHILSLRTTSRLWVTTKRHWSRFADTHTNCLVFIYVSTLKDEFLGNPT